MKLAVITGMLLLVLGVVDATADNNRKPIGKVFDYDHIYSGRLEYYDDSGVLELTDESLAGKFDLASAGG